MGSFKLCGLSCEWRGRRALQPPQCVERRIAMEESGSLRRLLGLSGWLAAAVAVVWAVVVCCEQAEEPRPDPGKRLDASVRRRADRPADGVARAKGRGKVAGKSVRSDGEMTVGVKWDASSLYGMLGDVSPDTAALAIGSIRRSRQRTSTRSWRAWTTRSSARTPLCAR